VLYIYLGFDGVKPEGPTIIAGALLLRSRRRLTRRYGSSSPSSIKNDTIGSAKILGEPSSLLKTDVVLLIADASILFLCSLSDGGEELDVTHHVLSTFRLCKNKDCVRYVQRPARLMCKRWGCHKCAC